jgi:polysaccharide pyruvyl transferase WcaK-like protein
VLVVNAYSVENRGDAAIVAGLIAILRDVGAVRVTVSARGWRGESERWRELGADAVVAPVLNIHEIPRWAARPRPLMLAYLLVRAVAAAVALWMKRARDPAVRAYLQADLVVSAGGAYLGGSKIGTNLIKAINIRLGLLADRPVVIAPMTITPPSRAVATILSHMLRGTTLFVRDEQSRVVAQRLGLSAAVSRDLAFRSPAVLSALTGSAIKSHGGRHLVVGWAPRAYRPDHDTWTKRRELEQSCIDAVGRLVGEGRGILRFVAQTTVDETDDDMQAVDRLRQTLPKGVATRTTVSQRPANLREAVAMYAGLDILLAGRLHAGLLALSAGVPALVIGYEPKVEGVLSGLGLSDRVIPPDASWSGEQIAEQLIRLRTPAEIERTNRARQLAVSGFDDFESVLQGALTAIGTG